MKKYFIPLLLSIGFPLSVSATNYVECEAIRAVISRNGIQKDEAIKNAGSAFRQSKVEEKYNGKDCYSFPYDSYERKQCQAYELTVFSIFGDEYSEFRKSIISPYEEIDERATKDFKKRGCYWF